MNWNTPGPVAVQASLFPEVEPELPRIGSRGRFLSDMAALMATFERSTVLDRLLRQSVGNAKQSKSQAWGNAVEEELGRLLTPEEARQELGDDLVRCAGRHDAFTRLVHCAVEVVSGVAAPQDLLLRLTFENGSGYVVMVNLKALQHKPGKQVGTGLSLSTFMRLATEPDFDPSSTTAPKGYDADLAILEILAGRRAILPGRDYYTLQVYTAGGTVLSWRLQGLLAAVTDTGSPCVQRHKSRDVIRVLYATKTLPAGYDINRRVAMALMPPAGTGALRVRIAATIAGGGKLSKQVADRLLTMTDAELLARVLAP